MAWWVGVCIRVSLRIKNGPVFEAASGTLGRHFCPRAGNDLEAVLLDDGVGALLDILHMLLRSHVLGLLIRLETDFVNLILDCVRCFHLQQPPWV